MQGAARGSTHRVLTHYIGESFVRFWVTGDPSYDSLQFDINSLGYFRQRAVYISTRQDITPNLSPFAAKGGKVLMLHGAADQLIPTASAEDFYGRIVTSMGAASVASFLKFYEVPGYGHGNGAFNVSWDSVVALEAWVEHGTAPSAQTARDSNASQNNRTRPLCEYRLAQVQRNRRHQPGRKLRLLALNWQESSAGCSWLKPLKGPSLGLRAWPRGDVLISLSRRRCSARAAQS